MSKVIEIDDFKHCHVEYEGTEGFNQVYALFRRTQEPRSNVAAVQETHFTCSANCRVLESDFNVFSAYGSRTSSGVSMLVGHSLDADVDVVFAGNGRLTGCGRCCR